MSYFGFDASGGTGFDQAPFNPILSIVARREAQFEPKTDLKNGVDRLIQQYEQADTLRVLLNAELDTMQRQEMTPLARLNRMQNIDLAEGVWLDRIGDRLGLKRPQGEWVFANIDKVFGFDGSTMPGFDQVPFDAVNRPKTHRPAINDRYYRPLLKGRARCLRSRPTLIDLRACLHAMLGDDASIGLIEAPWAITIEILDYPAPYLPSIIRRLEIRRLVLPVQAGVEVVIRNIRSS